MPRKWDRFCHDRSPRLRQPQVGFVDERRGLKRLAGPFTPQIARGQTPQLVVDDRQQLRERFLAALACLVDELFEVLARMGFRLWTLGFGPAGHLGVSLVWAGCPSHRPGPKPKAQGKAYFCRNPAGIPTSPASVDTFMISCVVVMKVVRPGVPPSSFFFAILRARKPPSAAGLRVLALLCLLGVLARFRS